MLTQELKEKMIEGERLERYARNIKDEIKKEIIEESGIFIKKKGFAERDFLESEIVSLKVEIQELQVENKLLKKTRENIKNTIRSIFQKNTDTKEKQKLFPNLYWEIYEILQGNIEFDPENSNRILFSDMCVTCQKSKKVISGQCKKCFDKTIDSST